jgi:hypothetical protein
VLTRGQVDTILNVVLEKGHAAEAAAGARPAFGARPARAEPARAPSPSPRWPWGLAGVAAAACAALLLFPRSGPRPDKWHEKGAADGTPAPQLFCFDEEHETATPLTDRVSSCATGERVSVQAAALAGLDHVSVVACDRGGGCRLIDSVDPRGRPSVSVFGPRMEAAGRWTIFTIWSAAPLAQPDVDAALARVRAKGGDPNALDALPLPQPNKQIAAIVMAGERGR